ncbi:MAG TPA: NAD(P)H-quinone oxidoreductase [Xanthobacteraceae bacterium]|jgi:NADPH2:quinone reductase|nr:NAD(P)H-quinone oxidoreductase [Xanthobacteraceae bacterium]
MPNGGLPKSMTSIAIREPGGPDMLVPQPQPVPSPHEGEILVKVAAAGVNRPDVMQRQGHYPPPKGATEIPGLEIAGEVVQVGPGVTRWNKGDKVMALVVGGGYAEYCLAYASHALPVPTSLSMIEAAAIPETFFTVWHNVFERGKLTSGETLLVHGGSSGIGTTAIQLGKAFGAHVIVTAGTPEKCDACRKLGADLAINYTTEDFVALSKQATQGRGVELILDMVGGEYVGRNYEAAAVEGRIVQIAFLASSRLTVDLMRLMLKRLTHTGSTLRARAVADKAAIAQAVEKNVLSFLASGRVKPLIDSTFPLAQANAAQARMESGKHIGKIVLTL